jgi:hypothetical protein
VKLAEGSTPGSPEGSLESTPDGSIGPARLGKADVHIHSIASDGTASAAQILDYAETQTDLDVIAVADHERIEAAFECQRLARERGTRVQVVVAEEVTTRSGHLLGVFLQARLKRNQRLETTVAEIHEQGGLAIVPHPFSAFTLGMRKHAIMRVHLSTDPLVYWDALEGFNPSTAGRYGRAATARIAAELGLPLVGNSDAHDRGRPYAIPRYDGRGVSPGNPRRDGQRRLHHLGRGSRGSHLRPPGSKAGPRRLTLGPSESPPRRRSARPGRPGRSARTAA